MYLVHDLCLECYHDNSIHQLISCTQQESLIIAVIVIAATQKHCLEFHLRVCSLHQQAN